MTAHRVQAGEQGTPIGAVVSVLSAEFTGLTVSKIRFLESQGLLSPERSESGTRVFLPEDLARLRYILTAQRDKFWPLRVIREHLSRIDGSDEPLRELRLATDVPTSSAPTSSAPTSAAASAVEGSPATAGSPPDAAGGAEEASSRGPTHLRPVRRRAAKVSPTELRESTGLDLATYSALKSFGLLRVDAGGRHGIDDVDIARQAAALSAYGIEARHLRLFRVAADREIGLAEQILEPLRRRRARGGSGADPEEVQGDIVARGLALHTALVRAGLSASR